MTATAAAWFTAAEIARMNLPGVPNCRRKLHDQAAAEGWAARISSDGSPLARPRKASGGGTEYHVSLLPDDAQALIRVRALAAENGPIAANDCTDAAAEAWRWYESLPDRIKAKAAQRMAILMEIEGRIETGTGRTAATQEVARAHGVSPRAVAEWYTMAGKASRHDWLPYLAPQYKGGGKETEIDATAWQMLKSKYLTNSRQPFAACYNQVLEEYAQPNGIVLPCRKTLERRMKKEVSSLLRKGKRDGREAVTNTVPPLRRSVASLHAMEAVNIDGHVCDVFVNFGPDAKGKPIIARPVLIGIQDVYSRKILAHRIGRTENTRLVRSTFADLFRDWGIPGKVTLDNGRAFASKAMTGGAKTRFRFVIQSDEQTGILTALGIETKWALPYSGRSKPIERAWKELCDYAAKSFSMVGAYTGNKPGARPEDAGSRAIPIADFEAHLARVIARHNARPGRTSEAARGRSLDDTFAASYSASAVKIATEAQMRIALLEAKDRRCDRNHGSVTIHGNSYWAAELVELAGEMVTVRFDADNLHSAVHVYRKTGEYVCEAAVRHAVGFYDTDAAERQQRAKAEVRKKFRAAEEAAELLTAAQVAALEAGHSMPAPRPAPGASRIVHARGHVAAALKPTQQAVQASSEPAFIDVFAAGLSRLRHAE